MRRTATLALLAAAGAAAVFPGAGTLCEAVFDAESCEFVARFDPLHEAFFLRAGLLDDHPPPPAPAPPPPDEVDEMGDVGSGDVGSGA
jgi:hypothetical protein